MFSQVHILAILAVFAQSTFAASCSRTYVVKDGDYCDKISQDQNVSTFQLAVVNSGSINSDCTNLAPGQVICLGFDGEDCSTTQVVQPGDTCSSIAAANGLNQTILNLNNPQLDDACDIYVGEVLCTSPNVQVPAIPSGGLPVTMGQSAPVSTDISNATPVPSPTAVDGGSPPANNNPTPSTDNNTTPSPNPVVDTPDHSSPTTSTTPTPTPAPNTPANNNPTPMMQSSTTPSAPQPSDNHNGNDNPNDDQLPFCDEL